MTTKVAINGFGRIGRLTFRAALEAGRDDLEFVGINDLYSAAEMAHLLKWDSVHKRLPMDISVEGEDTLIVDGNAGDSVDAGTGWTLVDNAVVIDTRTYTKYTQDAATILVDNDVDQTAFTAVDRKSTRLNSSHSQQSRMPSSA